MSVYRPHAALDSACLNSTQTSARFGIFLLPVMSVDTFVEAQYVLQSAIEDVEAAEIAGLDAAWVAEHHGTRYGGACPNGMMLLAHFAGRTSRIRLGTAASILPLHD